MSTKMFHLAKMNLILSIMKYCNFIFKSADRHNNIFNFEELNPLFIYCYLLITNFTVEDRLSKTAYVHFFEN